MAPISKTDYLLWRECPKNAWLRIHRPELYHSAEITEFERSIIEAGIEVEKTARGLFPEGLLVTGSVAEAGRTTLELLSSTPRTLFEPAFEREQLIAIVDVLRRDHATGGNTVFEIKSSTNVKEEHAYDLAFQVVLLQQLGIRVERAFVVHLNSKYIRQSDDLDLQQLFVMVDMTDKIGQISEDVKREMQESRQFLLNEIEPKGPCSCIYKGRSRHCSTFDYSNPEVPKYGIHDISRIGSSPKMLKELMDAGTLELGDLPSNFKLTANQRAQLRAYRTGETTIDKAAISKELGSLCYPLHFIDYETFASPIPLFPNYSPYDQIPLQYSLHIVGSPGEEPVHRDFLHIGSCDPSASFVDSLRRHIAPFGAIIVWNQGFESHVNDEIARRLPDARDYLFDFNDRLFDLMDIFSRQYFVHKDLYGKTSIKKVLPVLAPHLSYSSLPIHDGATASLVWMKLMSGQLGSAQTAIFLGQLQEYCALDSYGMYAIWQALGGVVNG
jgi:hypothetical protein